jgi:hypothetical protein
MGTSRKTDARVQQLVDVIVANPGMKRGELKDRLGLDTSESTVYRLIKAAMLRGLISADGITSTTQYFPTEKLALRHVQDYLARPIAQRKPIGYNFDWLERYEPNKTFLLRESDLERLQARCEPGSAPFSQISQAETNQFIAEFCYASSNLEGNVYDYGSTIQLTELNLPKVGADIKETKMILNHRAAIKYAINEVRERGSLELTPFNIRALHALLSHDLLDPGKLGSLRGSIPADPHVAIADSSYRPSSSPAAIDQAFAQVMAKAAAIENPYEASFFMLVHLPYLQPFYDCNKRTARMACNLPLINAGITPISWMSSTTHKQGYTDGTIAVYELNDINLLANVFVDNFMRSAEIFDVIRRDRQPNIIGAQYHDELKTYIRGVIAEGSAQVPARVAAAAAADFLLFAQAELDAIKLNPMVGIAYGLSPHATAAWVRSQGETEPELARVAERQR